MCSVILDAGGLDPTVVIGGQVKALGTGGRLGRGDYLVAETDESDRSFLLLKPTVAVVTNIDDEHMNAYRSRKDLEDSFKRFVESVPFYGLAILCIDDPTVRMIAKACKRRVVTYGFSDDAQMRAENIVGDSHGMEFDVVEHGERIGRFRMPMLGRHLVQNALAAIAVGREFGIAPEVIQGALASFGGVKRRLEVIGTERSVTVVNDYGHHPTEVRATLRAIKECFADSMRRFIVVFQPHRYSRTQLCWNEFVISFADADHVIITDVYAASEEPIERISGEALCHALQHPSHEFVAGLDAVPNRLTEIAAPGDVVLCLGAGSIGSLPEKILRAFAEAGAAEPVTPGASVDSSLVAPAL
jgi:UDP-N-acetylmuramate--alanine ligase